MNAVVIGRSNIVGRPMSILLSRIKSGKLHSNTIVIHIQKISKKFAAMQILLLQHLDKPGFLTGDMVKEGAVVIDVGITRVPDATKKKRICH